MKKTIEFRYDDLSGSDNSINSFRLVNRTSPFGLASHIGISSLVSLFLISSLLFSSFILSFRIVSADDSVVDDISITVPISCTLSGTGNDSHTATVNSGTYRADIGTTTLKASCNDNSGFSIYAAGYTGEVIGETNSNKLVGTPSTIGTISTGTATSGSTSNWAMKLATDSGATYPITIDNGFNSYSSVPNEYIKVAHRDSGTDIGTSAIGSVLTTTYATYISSIQTAGTYEGKVIYTLVHPSNAPAPVSCNPNATTIAQAECLQDFTGEHRDDIIASMTPETQYTLKDSRDGKTYTIAKYEVEEIGDSGGGENPSSPKGGGTKSGEEPNYDVWMTQNLDLDLQAGVTYTNLDTDIGYNTTTGEYDTASWTPERSTYTTDGTWDLYDGNTETFGSYIHPESYDPGNLYWNGTTSDYTDWDAYLESCEYDEVTNTSTCNESLNPLSTYTGSTGIPQYHLGNYYNWTAAVAMNDSSSHTTGGELIEQSICPAGWTLPRSGGGNDSFYSLWKEYGYDENNGSFSNISTIWSSPLYFPATGYYNGVLNNAGGNGSFWSPVVRNSYDSFGATFYVNDNGNASSSAYNNRNGGFSVRCIARPVAGPVSGGGGGDVIEI